MRKAGGSPPVQTPTSSSRHSRPGLRPRDSQTTERREVAGQGGVRSQPGSPSPTWPHTSPKPGGAGFCLLVKETSWFLPRVPASPAGGFHGFGSPQTDQAEAPPWRGASPCFCPGLGRTWKESRAFGAGEAVPRTGGLDAGSQARGSGA